MNKKKLIRTRTDFLYAYKVMRDRVAHEKYSRERERERERERQREREREERTVDA